jgi:hypothetical protein
MPPQQMPPQQMPPQPYGPPPGYPPQQPPPPYGPPQQYGPPPGQPIVLPIEGTGPAKLAARMNKRSLVISAEGFAHQNKKGGFRVAWPELRRIVVTTGYHQDKTKLFAPKVWRVRVIMDAADPGFAQRHPELGNLQGKFGGTGPGSYGLPLGPVNNMVGPLAQALGTYAGQLFGGVIEEGQVLGFGYV